MRAAVCSYIVLALSASAGDDAELYEWLRDCQATNRASFPKGLMTFEVSSQVGPAPKTVALKSTVLWDGDKAFWTYRISDPGKLVTGTWDRTGPVDQARTEYVFVDGKTLYWFNAYTNMLMIHPFEGPNRGGVGFDLWAVLPSWFWYRCCPPGHTQGRDWAEMIGPTSPAMTPASVMSVERLPSGLIRQIRDDRGRGAFEVLFDPDLCGNPIEVKYTAHRESSRHHAARYEWRKLEDGRCVLQFCEGTESKRGSRDVESRYVFRLLSFEPNPDVSPSRLSLEAMKGFLPRNTRVSDAITNKDYWLFRDARPAAPSFEPLVSELRSRGFLKK